MSKIKLKISLIVFAIGIIVFIITRLSNGGEDNWICQNGQWIKHGNPQAVMPTTPCPNSTIETQDKTKEKDIFVISPEPNELIISPLTIEGLARGTWFFEASFPVKLIDDNNNELAVIAVQATKDWMTESFVPFKGEMTFNAGTAKSGKLIFQKDNPSGLSQYDKQIEVPIKFSPAETMFVKIYFNNEKMDPEASCNKVFAVERQVIKTEAIARATLEELLKGPTVAERQQGYFTSINPGVKIQKLIIENGIAKIDFDEQIQNQVGGSCRVSAIRAEISETLKQFSTVRDVVISVNGNSEEALQP